VRTFGAEGKGIYSLITNSATIIGVSLSLSLNNGAIYYVKRGEITPRAGLLMILWNSLCVALLVLIALLMFKDYLWKLFFAELTFSYIYLILIVVYIPILLLNLYLVSYYLALHKTEKHRALVSTAALVTMITTVLLVIFFNVNISGALIVLMVTEAIYVIYFAVNICRESPLAKDYKKIPIRDVFVYGLHTHLAVLRNNITTRLDLLIVAAYISPVALGYYSVAKYLYQAILSIPGAINGLLFGAYCDRGVIEAHRMNTKVFWSMFALLLVLILPALLFAEDFLTFFYGSDFSRAVPVFNILLIAAILGGASSSYHYLFLACGHPEITSKIAVISGIVNVIMIFVLIPRFSIEGAAMSTVAGTVCVFIMRLYYGRKNRIECLTPSAQ
jgi:O-antigen/teichoic acid export membrane protein